MSAELPIFYLLAALVLGSAVATVAFTRNVVAGVASLLVCVVSLSGIFVLLGAEFLAVAQILLYSAATVVLLLFVVMLLDLESDAFGPARPLRSIAKAIACLLAIGLGAIVALATSGALPAPAPAPALESLGDHRAMGRALFSGFAQPVEVAGLVLLVAIVGAVILSQRRVD